MNSATELLIKARSLMSKDTWCVDYRLDEKGRHCALGYLDAAEGIRVPYKYAPPNKETATYQEAVRALAAAAPEKAHKWAKKQTLGYDESVREAYFDTFTVARHNNTTDYETVVKWFDRVIAVRQMTEAVIPELGVAGQSATQ